MSAAEYPEYIRRMLAQAETMITDDDHGPAEAAALCYEVLALFPDHTAASALVHKALSDPWLIREMRYALTQHIDEWDDRPWQERRRLAFSYRVMSHWDDLYSFDEGAMWPQDVCDMAEEGRRQLQQDYLLGQTRGAEVAWNIFEEAIRRTHDPARMLLAAGYVYADQGYFAEAVDMLERALVQGAPTTQTSRLLAEVRWWRDNQENIPWIPPVGDGTARRYKQMMARLEPELAQADAAVDPALQYTPPDIENLPADFVLPQTLAADVMEKIAAVLAGESPSPVSGPVDWRYLDRLEKGEVDVTQLPEWAQYLLLELDNPEQEMLVLQYVLSVLANPPVDEEE
ncbi:MAG: hypothetical protein KC413_16260 [Anaerolineales bacterium]|nr:hypothetical protein [Anaerolineales bacterium]